MKRLMPSLILAALFVTACNTSAPPEATAEIVTTVAEETVPAAETETPAPATEIPATSEPDHSFETGSASLAIEVPLDGRLAEPIEIETEHGIRFSAAAGTLLRTLSGMFVTGPITIGIDDAGDFGALPDDIEVDGVVRLYVLVQTTRGPELLNVRFEPAVQLQLNMIEEGADERVIYIPAVRGDGHLLGPLPEAAAVVTGVLAAPANPDRHPQNSNSFLIRTAAIIEVNPLTKVEDERFQLGAASSLFIPGFVDENTSLDKTEDPIDIKVGGCDDNRLQGDILNLLSTQSFDALNAGTVGPGGSFTSKMVLCGFPRWTFTTCSLLMKAGPFRLARSQRAI